MIEAIPTWLAVPLIITAGLGALYLCYIKPGYEQDKSNTLDRKER